MTKKTNEILHKTSKIVANRKIDEANDKQLFEKAWVEPPSVRGRARSKSSVGRGRPQETGLTGTIYNQFYKINPERKPMRPLPANIDDQLNHLETQYQSKHNER